MKTIFLCDVSIFHDLRLKLLKVDLQEEDVLTKNNLRTKNEIEKWHLRQLAKTVPLFKTGKVR